MGGMGLHRGQPGEKPKNMKGTLLRLWRLTRGNRKGLGWIMLLSVLASASAVASPLIIGRAINAIDSGGYALRIVLLLLLALYLGDWLVRFLQQFLMASISQKIILHIRRTLFSAMKKLPLAFFDRRQHGELMSRLTNDVDNISTTISDSLSQLLVFAFTILGILGIMLRLSLTLTCVALSMVIFFYIDKGRHQAHR
jgi:ATP-binding cassette subfamily B protein